LPADALHKKLSILTKFSDSALGLQTGEKAVSLQTPYDCRHSNLHYGKIFAWVWSWMEGIDTGYSASVKILYRSGGRNYEFNPQET
jgi:hypothetical protein